MNPPHERASWHSSQITGETGLNDRGRRAHGPRKNKEGRRRSLRCAKLSATQPKSHRITSKAKRVGSRFSGVARDRGPCAENVAGRAPASQRRAVETRLTH